MGREDARITGEEGLTGVEGEGDEEGEEEGDREVEGEGQASLEGREGSSSLETGLVTVSVVRFLLCERLDCSDSRWIAGEGGVRGEMGVQDEVLRGKEVVGFASPTSFSGTSMLSRTFFCLFLLCEKGGEEFDVVEGLDSLSPRVGDITESEESL